MSLLGAGWIRFDFELQAAPWHDVVRCGAVLVAWRSAAYEFFRLPRFAWRWWGLAEGAALTLANASGSILTVLTLSAAGLRPTLVSLLATEWLLAQSLLLAVAAAYSACSRDAPAPAGPGASGGAPETSRVVIYGAGRQGRALLREVRSNPGLPFEVFGFVDDDAAKKSTYLSMAPVLGSGAELGRLAELHRIEQILVAISSPTPQQRARIREMAGYAGRPCRFIPPWSRIILRKPPAMETEEAALSESAPVDGRRGDIT